MSSRSRGISDADGMPHYAMDRAAASSSAGSDRTNRSRSGSFAENVPVALPTAYDWTVTAVPRTSPTIRLFCIPHAGQLGTNPYHQWAQYLPEHVEQVTLIPGGRARVDAILEGGGELDASTDPDAARLNSAVSVIEGLCFILATQTDVPFALFGHSAGAALALHTVAMLQRQGGVLPMHLFVSGCPAPHDFEEMASGWQEPSTLLGLVREWSGGAPLDWAEDPDARSVYLGRLRADLQLLEASGRLMQNVSPPDATGIAGSSGTGALRQPLKCDVTVVGGEDDPTVPEEALTSWAKVNSDGLGVVDVSIGARVEIVRLPGGHFYLENEGEDGEQVGAKLLLSAVSSALQSALSTAQVRAEASVRAWNNETMDYPSTKRLHDLFTEQATRTPDAIAICDPLSTGSKKSWTYKEVDEETDLLASFLVAKGCGPGKVVGIMMNRCGAYVLGYIAAHKAGGAYMPIELAYPPELVQRVLNETKAVAVLTHEPHHVRLPASQVSLIVDANGHWKDELQKAGHPRYDDPAAYPGRVDSTPDDLAYVVMSSGTTGVPKGIMCPHRGAVHSYHWRHEHYPLRPDDRAGCAVFFVWEVFRPLMRGLPTYVIPDDVIYDAEALSLYVRDNKITRILFTPSLLQLVLDSLDAHTLVERMGNVLRIVWLCGEVVTLELQHRFKALFPNCLLLNLYSISECHDVSVAVLEKFDSTSGKTQRQLRQYASCGKVMENVKCYVLDPNSLRNQPIGTPGEVYVGGPCLAIGYLNMPEKTAERFVPNPFLALDGPGCERLYRTGDRGRFLPDGTLELCGRCDSMVKIRGYSVVLGAVEAALAEHALVSTAVVLAEGDEGTDKRLVAYIVPATWQQVPSAHELRVHLKALVPFYAVPPVILLLNALPVAAIGKLEKGKLKEGARRLPSATGAMSPDGDAEDMGDTASDATETLSAGAEPAKPEGEIEAQLATVWQELLHIESVARRDSFFEVGGHSLLAVRLVAKLKQAFFSTEGSGTIVLGEVLRHPTLEQMAAVIEGKLKTSTGKLDASSTANVGSASAESIDGGTAAESIDWSAEAKLDDAIYPAATRKAGYSRLRPFETTSHLPPRRVLLTGATGYLGVFVLAELLATTEATVFCLARAEDDDAALLRVENNLRQYGLLPSSENDRAADGVAQSIGRAITQGRLVAIAGDLGKPLLGLSSLAHKELATIVDSIVHCASVVNLLLSYQDLKASNCLGTQEVLRLAVTNGSFETRVKPVFYISTNGVFPYGTGETFEETTPLAGTAHLSDGYAQSKYVAEQMVLQARSRGLPVCVLRPGNMAGSSRSGAWNRHDFVRTLLHGCQRLRADGTSGKSGVVPVGPEVENWRIDLTPVDWAAQAISHCVMHPATSLGRVFHVQSPHAAVPAADVFSWMVEVQNCDMVPLDEFQRLVNVAAEAEAATDGSGENDGADATLLQRLSAAFDSFQHYFVKPPVLKCDQLLYVLGNAFPQCAALDRGLLQTYLKPSGPVDVSAQ